MTTGLSEAERRQLMEAGSGALTHNAPLSEHRATGLIKAISSWGATNVVDFGCGEGAFASAIAESGTSAHVLGIDTIDTFVEAASIDSAATFEVADASTWSGSCDVAISIGSSHAFGGTELMFERFTELGASHVVIGDGFWAVEPDEWCMEIFGEMPRGLDAVAAEAVELGWDVIELEASTIEEWDAFERDWGDGVRGVGTPVAHSFADLRWAEYQRYRGTLGFSWLIATRNRAQPQNR